MRVARLQALIAVVGQGLGDQARDQRLVLDQQHRLSVAAGRLVVLGRLLRLRRGAREARQQQDHLRTLANLAHDLHRAARLAHEAVQHRQAETRALAYRLGGEEGLEHPLQHVGRHALTLVLDGDPHVVAGAAGARRGSLAPVEDDIGRAHPDQAAAGHGVARVDDQVQQGVLQLMRIAPRLPQPILAREGDFH